MKDNPKNEEMLTKKNQFNGQTFHGISFGQ
jgi:hypothetical protein